MKITKLEEQSLRLTVSLARRGGKASLAELAEAEHLTEASVAKIMGRLRKGGIIRALRGRTGGYALIPSAETLTAAGVIRALGKPVFESCASAQGNRSAPCPHISDCSLRPIWNYLSSAITDTLDRITISQLLRQEHPVRQHLADLKVM